MGLFRKSEPQDQQDDLQVFREQLGRVKLPAVVETAVRKELERLEKTPPSAAEYGIGLNYLEYLFSLPWGVFSEDNLDLARVEKILHQQHAGLLPVKERILEYLAVRTLRLQRRFDILVVDDEEIARSNLEHILKKEGYLVETAVDGIEALEKMEQKSFDLVLTDLLMTRMGGMELLEKIKSMYPSTEVVVITGYATVSSAVDALHKGAYSYLAKPLKLEEVRRAVREALSRKQTVHRPAGSVLCFAGPPGTGKTSLGRAIATALGRRFIRLSLGGMKDEAEIRGHRRSYAGAMPGRIIDAIRRAGTCNPVFMLDEIDKIGQDFHGAPASALLEVLDPEQNEHFLDYYLDVPFDLSAVMFIATANLAESLPGPLLDRMEVLELPGYTDAEKERIALEFLVPRQLEAAGLSPAMVRFTPAAIRKVIKEYTLEAGLRSLERQVAAICRKAARRHLAGGGTQAPMVIESDTVAAYLGPPSVHHEVVEARDRIGVTTGLAWTEAGGEMVFIEATMMRGSSRLILTGSLGEVMQESAQAALSYIRSNAELFGIDADFFREHDIHVHVPAGAIPKDGPSAGLTIALALISLLLQRPARRQVAVTGELTLSGRILPVRGVREKLMAARRAGVKTVILPEKNREDIADLDPEIRDRLEIVLTGEVKDIVDLVLLPAT